MNRYHLPFAVTDNVRRGSAVDGAPSYRRRPLKCGDNVRSHNGPSPSPDGNRVLRLDLTASDSASSAQPWNMHVRSSESTRPQAPRVPLRWTETRRDFTSKSREAQGSHHIGIFKPVGDYATEGGEECQLSGEAGIRCRKTTSSVSREKPGNPIGADRYRSRHQTT